MDFRHEYKYMISIPQSMILRERISSVMKYDSHTDETHSYEIRSVYFDDYRDSCLAQNEAGVDPRSKYRIRIYNASNEQIVLEKKIKKNGMTRKLQEKLSMEQYHILTCPIEVFLADGKIHSLDGQPQLVRELMLLRQTNMMAPKVIVNYERTPFVEENGNVRVTFDDAIASSEQFEDFFSKDLHKRAIMPLGMTLMEVKYDEFLPEYIRAIIESGHLQQTTFSKYYLCRRYHL